MTSLDISPNRLQLLDIDLLHRPGVNREIDRLVRVLGMSYGWHYRLDVVWILAALEAAQIRPPATVVDVGAGTGVLQFLLAARGYRVISIDYSERRISPLLRLTHRVRVQNTGLTFDTEYTQHLARLPVARQRSARLRKAFTLLTEGGPLLVRRVLGRGSVTFCRADMSDMRFVGDASVDAVVSLSALEHVEREDIPKAIAEFHRIVKPGGSIICTTSATERNDWFHEPSKGWCFSAQTLAELFGLGGRPWDNFGDVMQGFRTSRELQEQMPQWYFQSGNNGMPWGRWDPQYLPVGVWVVARDGVKGAPVL